MRRRRLGYGNGTYARSAPTRPLRTGGFRGAGFQQVSAELKVIENTNYSISNVICAAASPTLLNGVDQGTDYNQRLGRKIVIQSIYLRMGITPAVAASYVTGNVAHTGQKVRVMLVVDKQTNGAAFSATDLLGGGATTESMNNLSNRERFVVLYDKVMNFGPGYYSAGVWQPLGGYTGIPFFKIYKKIKIPTVYMGTGATVGSIATNGLYLIGLTDTSTANATNLAFYGTYRIRFRDA